MFWPQKIMCFKLKLKWNDTFDLSDEQIQTRIIIPQVGKGAGKKNHTYMLYAEGIWQYVSKGLKIPRHRHSTSKNIFQDKNHANVKDIPHFINSKMYIFHLDISETGVYHLINDVLHFMKYCM